MKRIASAIILVLIMSLLSTAAFASRRSEARNRLYTIETVDKPASIYVSFRFDLPDPDEVRNSLARILGADAEKVELIAPPDSHCVEIILRYPDALYESTEYIAEYLDYTVEESRKTDPHTVAAHLRLETEEDSKLPDSLTFHTNRKMGMVAFPDFASTYLENSEEARLARKIFRVKGIVSVDISQYQVYLEKGKLFSWNDITPQVVNVLSKHFADKDKKAAEKKSKKKRKVIPSVDKM